VNTPAVRDVSRAMNDDLAHADTLRPPAPSPWLDAPTHDGLWWVKRRDARPILLVVETQPNALWYWMRGLLDEDDFFAGSSVPDGWKFAPATLFAPPTP
jgi:hypothetical protein